MTISGIFRLASVGSQMFRKGQPADLRAILNLRPGLTQKEIEPLRASIELHLTKEQMDSMELEGDYVVTIAKLES